jgi:hypothetical protein
MLITNYAVIKLYRNDQRQWIILGQCNDLPGGVRPYEVWPIVGIYDHDKEEVKEIPRSRAPGYITADEQTAYVYMKFLKRAFEEIVTVVDEVRVELNGVRIA